MGSNDTALVEWARTAKKRQWPAEKRCGSDLREGYDSVIMCFLLSFVPLIVCRCCWLKVVMRTIMMLLLSCDGHFSGPERRFGAVESSMYTDKNVRVVVTI